MSVSGDDVDAAEMRPPTAPPVARRRSSASDHAAHTKAEFAGACYFCQEPLRPKDNTKTWHGYVFHASPCWNNIRARQRVCYTTQNGLRRELELMNGDPEKWRCEAMQFDRPHLDSNRLHAREALTKQLADYVLELQRMAELTLTDTAKYTKAQYKKAKLRGMDSDEASADWDSEYAEHPTVNKKGETCIAIEGPEVTRKLEGTERQGVKRGLIESAPGTSSWSSGAASSGGDGASPASGRTGGKSGASLTEMNIQRLTDAFNEIREDDVISVVSTRARGSRGARLAPQLQPSQGFLKQKDDIGTTLREIVSSIDGSKKEIGAIKKLQALHTKAVEKNIGVGGLPHDVSTVIGDLSRVSSLAKGELEKIGPAKVDAVPSLEEALTNIQKQKSTCLEQVQTLTDQLNFKFQKACSEQRSEYQKNRWEKTKIQHMLSKGGFGLNLSKWASEQIHSTDSFSGASTDGMICLCEKAQLNPEDGSFDVAKLALFTGESPNEDCQSHSVWWGMKLLLDDAAKVFIDSKITSMKAEMANHPLWPGAMGGVSDCFANVDAVATLGAQSTKEKGSECWLVCARAGVYRIGPQSVPMPGTPSILVAMDKPLLVHAVRMKDFLGQGIAVNNYEQFLATATGADIIKQSTLVIVNPGDSLYVPTAWWWSLTVIAGLRDTDTVGMATVVPVYSPSLWGAAQSNEQGAIVALNKAHFDTKKCRAMWDERAAAFGQVFATSSVRWSFEPNKAHGCALWVNAWQSQLVARTLMRGPCKLRPSLTAVVIEFGFAAAASEPFTGRTARVHSWSSDAPVARNERPDAILVCFNHLLPDIAARGVPLERLGFKPGDWGSGVASAVAVDAWDLAAPLEYGFRATDRCAKVLSVAVAALSRPVQWPTMNAIAQPQLGRRTAALLHEFLVSHGACDAEICAEEEAARRGTWMHWTFEAHLNRVPVPRDAVEFQLFLKYLGALRGLTAFRAEWAIFAGHEGLAGSIDFVARDSAGSLYIYDWKRAKNLRSKYTNPLQNMKFPLSRWPDCQGNYYRVQLNIYRWMLERYYGARVAAMHVVCLHPDNGDQPFVDDVPVIPEIEEPMAIQRTRSRELRAMASEDASEMDPLGGWPRPVVAARLP
ncbi:unnamed protein product [Prorocentrum cordatum]|uniref:PD-(D/E)XK endonuclease-like domain-containing protein n=1 Tax=Prorocentrum cordatum TaxID=2364126 RepID=A0ABN9PD95_9DINO|nr:unnamed protein product [Polarella glacialis]